jgi:hypothetical protein
MTVDSEKSRLYAAADFGAAPSRSAPVEQRRRRVPHINNPALKKALCAQMLEAGAEVEENPPFPTME